MEAPDARVGDFLDDKLQSLADLETLDSLLSNVQNQHELLRRQLQDAEKDFHESNLAAEHHRASIRPKAAAFQREQDDIDRRLRIITGSDVSDDAVRRFERSMNKLHRLDVANGYVELLKEVDALRNQSISQLKVSDEAALGPLRQLQTLNAHLVPLQTTAEGAAPHLLDHVTCTTKALRNHIRDAFAARFEDLLKKIYWPRADVALPTPALQQEWVDCISRLLDLQKPELQVHEETLATDPSTKEPIILLPIEVLVHPLELRFRYHFGGDRPTNRIDKPEYFLSHVTDLLNMYNDFFIDNVQPILLDHFRGTDLAMNPAYIDVTSALTTSLLPMLRNKIIPTLPQVASQPQLLSHWMHEIMGFDTTIRDDWGYDGGYSVQGWKGLAWEVLVKEDWFGRWLQVERDFALSRYEAIIDTPDSGLLDYDSVEPNVTKPTAAAIRVNDLLETITDRYRPLSSFQQKLRFLIDIQINIFDRFHARLNDGLEAYLTLTTTVGRSVSGISREDQDGLKGVKGLDRLCRVYGSADYLERAMRDWSDDIFFLELWDELQDRARGRTNKTIAVDMTIEDVAQRTSSAVGKDEDTGGLFDETANAYRRLRVRTEGIIIEALTRSVREALRPYGRINPWSTLSLPSTAPMSPSSPSSDSYITTSEIEPTISVLNTQLSFLARTLGLTPLRRIVRQACAVAQSYLWDYVVMCHTFSAAGAEQLRIDIRALVAAINRRTGLGQGEASLKKIIEGIVMLGLPIKRRSKRAKAGETSDVEDGDDAWENTEVPEDGNGEQQIEGSGAMGLWEAERRLFADDESAREVLEELGLEILSEAEARSILKRRIELSS
ncbi:hypothetical protein EV356DRAFT_441885 [Viridothelium virens]|uniref:RINT-1 family protein-like protein n=1 Tax=Viridothelium virens TaxID=1048519 RepID=A0A6A6HH74_VIRVR|nr:hypothetical protein EV356DRAFT_441885 [Viridothelium virens]